LKLSTSDVEYVAKLARLEVTEADKKKFTAQLNDILLYIDQLNELDTEGVAPMSHGDCRDQCLSRRSDGRIAGD